MGVTNFHDARYEQFVQLPRYKRRDFGNAVHMPEKDILIVKGQIMPTREERLSVLGLRAGQHIPERLSLEETVKIAAEENRIVLACHPFYRGFRKFLRGASGILGMV